jgi:hypothetical protein
MGMHLVYVVNSIGLLVDFIGFVLVYNSGSPSLRFDVGKGKFLHLEGFTKKQTPEQKMAETGVKLIMAGFSIQIFCSVLQIFN